MRRQRLSVRVAVVTMGGLAVGFAAVAVSVGVASASGGVQVPCSVGGPHGLIAAIDAAKQAGRGTLDLATRCTYTLTAPDNQTDGGNGLPVLTGEITINGDGATVARSAAAGTPEFRIIEVAEGATVSITHLTTTGGRLTGETSNGGGIDNEGTIGALSNDTIRDNSAAAGGGLYNNGLIGQLHNDRISDNTAHNGGGVFNLAMIRSFINDTVSGNKAGIGGGISSLGSIVKLNDSTISHNHLTANGAGGGIANVFGVITMTDDTVSHNTATGGPDASGGGIDNSGKLTLTGGVVEDNTAHAFGGGIRNEEQARAGLVLTVKSTKVIGNAVTNLHGPAGGGGLYNEGAMSVLHSEVRGNKAPKGGGLYVDDGSKKTAVDDSHITENHAIGDHPRGGGIFFAGGAPVTLLRTMVTANSPDNCDPPGKIAGCTG